MWALFKAPTIRRSYPCKLSRQSVSKQMFHWNTAPSPPTRSPNHGTGGYPITLQFPPFDKVTGVSAKLSDAKGNPVEFFLSDPQHPATSFGQFGVICLIPKQSLQAEHAYSVRIDAT